MKMHLETTEHNLISQYGVGVLSVNGTDYSSNLLVSRSRVYEDWFNGVPSELSIDDFIPLFELDAEERPEIVILGTGSEHIFPPFKVMADMKARGLSLEVMNTRAACRTYSVLISEYRSVAAALLQIER